MYSKIFNFTFKDLGISKELYFALNLRLWPMYFLSPDMKIDRRK